MELDWVGGSECPGALEVVDMAEGGGCKGSGLWGGGVELGRQVLGS